jgi:hypothetical protein
MKVQYFTACTLDGFIADEHDSLDWLYEVPHDQEDPILGMTPVTLGRGAPLLPRRITSKELAFREARLIGQRIRIVLEVGRVAAP